MQLTILVRGNCAVSVTNPQRDVKKIQCSRERLGLFVVSASRYWKVRLRRELFGITEYLPEKSKRGLPNVWSEL